MLYSKYHLVPSWKTSERWPQNFNKTHPEDLAKCEADRGRAPIPLLAPPEKTAGHGFSAGCILSSFYQGNTLTWHKHKHNGISEYRYHWCRNVGCLLLVTGGILDANLQKSQPVIWSSEIYTNLRENKVDSDWKPRHLIWEANHQGSSCHCEQPLRTVHVISVRWWLVASCLVIF